MREKKTRAANGMEMDDSVDIYCCECRKAIGTETVMYTGHVPYTMCEQCDTEYRSTLAGREKRLEEPVKKREPKNHGSCCYCGVAVSSADEHGGPDDWALGSSNERFHFRCLGEPGDA